MKWCCLWRRRDCRRRALVVAAAEMMRAPAWQWCWCRLRPQQRPREARRRRAAPCLGARARCRCRCCATAPTRRAADAVAVAAAARGLGGCCRGGRRARVAGCPAAAAASAAVPAARARPADCFCLCLKRARASAIAPRAAPGAPRRACRQSSRCICRYPPTATLCIAARASGRLRAALARGEARRRRRKVEGGGKGPLGSSPDCARPAEQVASRQLLTVNAVAAAPCDPPRAARCSTGRRRWKPSGRQHPHGGPLRLTPAHSLRPVRDFHPRQASHRADRRAGCP